MWSKMATMSPASLAGHTGRCDVSTLPIGEPASREKSMLQIDGVLMWMNMISKPTVCAVQLAVPSTAVHAAQQLSKPVL